MLFEYVLSPIVDGILEWSDRDLFVSSVQAFHLKKELNCL